MDFTGIERPYWCIDTFEGFKTTDIEHERSARGKSQWSYDDFMTNDIRWFRNDGDKQNQPRRGLPRRRRCFRLLKSWALAFVIIDVDLHRPVAACLEAVWEVLCAGGVIPVDDCSTENLRGRFDGALQPIVSL
jgi:hypothetical protein